MAMTRVPLSTRLPLALHEEAAAHAAEAGLSLNALLAVALRAYLDGRPRPRTRSSVQSVDGLPALQSMPSQAAGLPQERAGTSIKAPGGNRNAPCPCGATKADGYPVKWKHCHGAPTTSGSS